MGFSGRVPYRGLHDEGIPPFGGPSFRSPPSEPVPMCPKKVEKCPSLPETPLGPPSLKPPATPCKFLGPL